MSGVTVTHDTEERMTPHDHDHDHGEPAGGIGRRGLMRGCGAGIAFALTGGVGTAVAGHDEEGDDFENVADLLEGMPDNWGRWGEDDGLGALNLLGSEQLFDGLLTAIRGGRGNVERFTLQLPMTGFAIDELVDDPDPDDDGTTTDTGDPMFPGRFPARRDNWADASEDTLPLTVPGGMTFADDALVTPLYLQGATHCDALGHGWYGDAIYNGYPLESTHTRREYELGVDGFSELKLDEDGDGETPELGAVTETYGLGEADVSYAADAGVAGRGVLLDVGRYRGEEGPDGNWLPLDPAPLSESNPDAAVTLEDLQATAEAQGVKIQERDILLIRTGAIERTLDPEAEWNALGEPGLSYSDELLRWIHEMDIPYIGADNLAIEQIFQTVTEDDLEEGRTELHGDYALPLHGALLRDLGVTLNEVLDLSELAAQCADDGTYEFLFTAGPLHVEMGTGAPVNPVVIKGTDGDDVKRRRRG